MPSFDIVSEVDLQMLDNSINVAKKEIVTRFDFRNSKTIIELNKKDKVVAIHTEDEMRLNSVIDILRNRMLKQKVEPTCLDYTKEHYGYGSLIRKDLAVRQGIDKENAKKIQKEIKDSKIKVNAQIMDDLIRVQGKKLDDLQAVIALVKGMNLEIPFQFVNMKS